MDKFEIEGVGSIDPRHTNSDGRRQVGRDVRKLVPRTALGEWAAPADRPDPVDLLEQQNASRLPDLVPIRYGRMMHSPFTYL
ncbi:MAG: DUF2252 domain-containing protein, partial [Actinomycetes bacterium]